MICCLSCLSRKFAKNCNAKKAWRVRSEDVQTICLHWTIRLSIFGTRSPLKSNGHNLGVANFANTTAHQRCAGALFFLSIFSLNFISWMRKNTSNRSISWMSLTAAVPIVIGLGARILFNTISKTPGSSGYLEPASTNGDYIVQGLFQGALLQYVF